jgi:hypothetical protein
MSHGPFDPTRMVEFMASAINGGGLAVNKPQVRAFPLTWSWRFNGPLKIWESVVASSSSGPFEGEQGSSISGGRPSQQDTAALPSQGTVVTFSKIAVPAGHNLSTLLDLLRRAKVDATRGSNTEGSGTLRLKTAPAGAPPALMAGVGVLGLILAWNMVTGGTTVR